MIKMTLEVANLYFLYNHITGDLIYKPRCRSLFKKNHSYSSWNNKIMNKPVKKLDKDGYLIATIFKDFYMAHRVCWLLYYGEFPKYQIDHINHIRADNRIVNLRDVSHTDNMKNKKRYKNNKSGFMGVSWDRISNRWVANITINKKQVCLGGSNSKAEAIKMRKEALEKSDFHKNHGKVEIKQDK